MTCESFDLISRGCSVIFNIFRYLLPPIIFYAGLSVKKKQFFRNFSSITLFGVLGTYISSAVIAGTLFVVSRLPGNSLVTLVSPFLGVLLWQSGNKNAKMTGVDVVQFAAFVSKPGHTL
jgi:NhaP-type Na+/H+ or K+/H+ antiporter